ncbi:MAG: hypothetical protein R3C14_04075 [Caldilineaceae bacterium]
MTSKNEFALEQLESRLEMHCGWHLRWTKICLVRIPFFGCVVYTYRPSISWYCH